MEQKDSKREEILKLKYKKMMERITRLEGIVALIYPLDEDKNQAIQIIKTYYQEMYNKILETGEYDKYEQVEDTILEGMAKIEMEIDKYIQDTYKSIGKIVQNRLKQITNFNQYNTQESIDYRNVLEQLDKYISNNTTNLEKLLEQINQIKEMVKLYEAYITPEEMQQIQEQISIAKFKILIRMQIGRALVGEDNPQSTLYNQHNSEQERKIFEQQLTELIKQNPNIRLEEPVSQIMQDSELLNKILEEQIIGIAEKNIDLLYAPIFNAHLCNIDLSFITDLSDSELDEQLKSIDAKISILSAVIDNFITKKDINIMYCDLVYKTFGFTCRPIILDKKQKAVTNLWQILKEKGKKLPPIEPNYETLLTGGEKRIPIKPRVYDFSSQDEHSEHIEDDELVKKLIATERDGEISETNEEEEEIIEKIRRTYNWYQDSFYISPGEEKRIEELKRKLEIIKKLRQTKQKDEQETVEEIKERLEARYDAFEFIGERTNKWRMLPLSSIVKKSATPKVSIEESTHMMRNSRASFGSYYEYHDVPVIIYDISELWENYIQSSNGIIKKPQYARDSYMEEGLRFRFLDKNNSLPSYFYLKADIDLSEIAGLPLNDKIMDEIMKLDAEGR